MHPAFSRKARSDYSSAAMACRRAACLGNTFKDRAYCLTGIVISNKLAAMNGDLDSLEQKITQVLTLYAQLRSENHALRERMTELEEHHQLLTSRAEAARTRLEAVMEKLPAE